MSEPSQRFGSFDSFYPFYLSEHRDPTCRKLHFLGTFLVFFSLIYLVGTRSWSLAWIVPVLGYGFAWAGHAFFEKNRPATFQYPLYSLMGDFRMFYEILTGRLAF
jgi:hypothetical protein